MIFVFAPFNNAEGVQLSSSVRPILISSFESSITVRDLFEVKKKKKIYLP